MNGRMDVKPCYTCGHDCLVAIDEDGTEKHFPVGWEDERNEMIEAIRSCIEAIETGRGMYHAVKMAESVIDKYVTPDD